jgi:hypothetical protein
MSLFPICFTEKQWNHKCSLNDFRREIQAVRASSYLQGILFCFGWLVGRRLAVFMSIVTYVMLYQSVTPEKVNLLSHISSEILEVKMMSIAVLSELLYVSTTYNENPLNHSGARGLPRELGKQMTFLKTLFRLGSI